LDGSQGLGTQHTLLSFDAVFIALIHVVIKKIVVIITTFAVTRGEWWSDGSGFMGYLRT